MHAILANTIWAPIFVYCYNWPWALSSVAVGFIAEFGVFRLYTRTLLSAAITLRRLVAANLVSFAAGFVLMAFMPFGVRKDSLAQTALAFFIAYIITLSIEFYTLRSLLPQNRRLLLRTVTMANFISYAILFTGYFLWFAGWRYVLRQWTGNA
jgi:hypothetical protein